MTMRKLILVLMLLVFSTTQGVVGGFLFEKFDIQTSTSELSNPISHDVFSGTIHNEDCCETHSEQAGNNASHCQSDCQLFFTEKYLTEYNASIAYEFVMQISVAWSILEASFRPPIS